MSRDKAKILFVPETQFGVRPSLEPMVPVIPDDVRDAIVRGIQAWNFSMDVQVPRPLTAEESQRFEDEMVAAATRFLESLKA